VETLKGRLQQVQSRLFDLRERRADRDMGASDREQLDQVARQVESLNGDLEALEALGQGAVQDMSIVIEQGLARLERDVAEVEARVGS
jgi:cob(I)alamin adenosyltransferase